MINRDSLTSHQLTSWGIEVVGREDGRQKGSNVKVSIIDSGINKNHSSLKGKVSKQFDFINQESKLEDKLGHGTAIAGIIAGNNEGEVVTGIAENVTIFDAKIIDNDNLASVEDLISAIEWSIDENVEIINISAGFEKDNSLLKQAIQKAIEKDIIIIAAAGNTYGLGVYYPAKYEGVISIGAYNEEFNRPGSSARGKIDYSAPGVNIYSTDKDGDYSIFTGTSFATAHVTGAIASLLSIYKSTPSELDFWEFVELHVIATEKEESEYGKGTITLKQNRG